VDVVEQLPVGAKTYLLEPEQELPLVQGLELLQVVLVILIG
jgi:hypothetical protein